MSARWYPAANYQTTANDVINAHSQLNKRSVSNKCPPWPVKIVLDALPLINAPRLIDASPAPKNRLKSQGNDP